MSEIKVREMRRDDFAAVRGLYSVTKSRLRSEAYDRWCLFDTPWGDSVAVVATDGAVCVGLFVLRPSMLDLGNVAVMGGQATDLMTHPDHRRKGLFVAMVEESCRIAASRGLEVIYAFPNRQGKSYPGFVHRLNFDHVGDVAPWICNLTSLRCRMSGWLGVRNDASVTIVQDAVPDGLQALMESSRDESGVCRVKRDESWLRWRYAQATGETYRWFIRRDASGTIQSALLVGERDSSWAGIARGDLRIHEVFARSDTALVAVLRTLRTCARNDVKTSLKILVKNPLVESALQVVGFRQFTPLPLVVRRLTTRTFPSNVHDFDAWRVMSGDVDVF